MKKFFLPIILLAFAMAFTACEEDELGPNELGGSTNLDYTKPGRVIGAYLNMNDDVYGVLGNIADSVCITKNDNGIVTTHAQFIMTSSQYRTLDTLLGTYSLSRDMKNALLDYYKTKLGAVLDTTNKEAVKLSFDMTGKVTSEGIQDFVHSGGNTSKPFTVVKYSGYVGDTWDFTDDQGKKYTRKVVSKSETEDYSYGPIDIKTIRVEETGDDDVIEKITYIANHKFGLVGIMVKFKNGKIAKLGLF